MRFAAVAVDYDGTLAHDGRVAETTAAALLRLRGTGRRAILVTGRELPDLRSICPYLGLFDLVVAENGALLYWPTSREQKVLAEPPPEEFVAALQARGIAPLSVGRVIVAAWQPHEAAVLDAIHALGLEHQVIFNKGAVMVLPPSVNKGSGLAAALRELHLSPHNVVAIGDAENDHALFGLAECAVAVANALPTLKERADLVIEGDHGAGVVELIDRLLADELADVAAGLRRHDVALGARLDGEVVRLPAHGVNVLIAGSSGSGKSTILAGLAERFIAAGYQLCLLDPEGDYEELAHAVVLGTSEHSPTVAEVAHVLEEPDQSAVVTLLGVPLVERPAYVAQVRAMLEERRTRDGRPHWIALDEAHHVLPRWGEAALPALFVELGQTVLVTVEPAHLAPDALVHVDVVIATGTEPDETIRSFCRAVDERPPGLTGQPLPEGEALVWRRGEEQASRVVAESPRSPHRRHKRKYAVGQLEPGRSFHFRGPAGAIDLRADSLQRFLALAQTVDDDVWTYHLRRGDFARWFRDVIRDEDLAAEATRGESLAASATRESRAIVRRAIERRYTLPE